MTAIDRTAYPRFGKRWTADELRERYGLSEGELTLVANHTIGDTALIRKLVAVILARKSAAKTIS